MHAWIRVLYIKSLTDNLRFHPHLDGRRVRLRSLPRGRFSD